MSHFIKDSKRYCSSCKDRKPIKGGKTYGVLRLFRCAECAKVKELK